MADASSIKEGVMLALRDPRLYLFTLLQHASLLSQTFQYFFPTILQTLGYGNIETLLLTVPVWVVCFLVSLVVTYTSGRFADRSIHIICLMLISVAGNIIVVATLNNAVRFFALFLLPMGAVPAYQVIPPILFSKYGDTYLYEVDGLFYQKSWAWLIWRMFKL